MSKETYPDYLRRVASDYIESDEDSPTAKDYEESASLIEDLASALRRMDLLRQQLYARDDVNYLLKRVTR